MSNLVSLLGHDVDLGPQLLSALGQTSITNLYLSILYGTIQPMLFSTLSTYVSPNPLPAADFAAQLRWNAEQMGLIDYVSLNPVDNIIWLFLNRPVQIRSVPDFVEAM